MIHHAILLKTSEVWREAFFNTLFLRYPAPTRVNFHQIPSK